MQFAIIISTQDKAGLNIKDNLIQLGFKETEELFHNHKVYQKDNITLYTTDKDTIHCEDIDKELEEDIIIFATKHKSGKGIPSLSIHVPGNWGNADFGGKERQLCTVYPSLMKAAFINLNKFGKDSNHEITLEVTHHGPLINKPCFFIEIGSNEPDWEVKESGKIIANTILETIKDSDKTYPKVAFGIGGLHYCPSFNQIELNSDIAMAHICPKYATEDLDKEMLQQAMERSCEKVDLAIIDWKSLKSEQRNRIIQILEELNINYERSTNIEK